MDIISFSEAATANGRIESFIENPDSTSGILTVPKVIASGENITIPAGRVAILPNMQIDGVLNIENGGEVFIPSGATFGDLDTRIALKADTTYVDAQIATRSILVQGTVQNSSSGTSIDFTGIHSWAKKITVMFNGVSTNSTSPIQIQIGSGSIQTTGYTGSNAVAINSAVTGAAVFTTGFGVTVSVGNTSAAALLSGVCNISNLTSSTYSAFGGFGSSTVGAVFTTAGSVTLSGTLDRIRITTVNGIDTFDAGQINILVEG